MTPLSSQARARRLPGAQASLRNELLLRLNAEDFALLGPNLETCSLVRRDIIARANSRFPFVYFFETGFGSVVATTPAGRDAEVGLIGFEGMTGSALVMGDDRNAHRCYVQMDGEANRIAVAAFSEALSASPTLRMFLLRYVQYFHVQATFTALVNARSKLEVRLARWLLMCDDRVRNGPLSITHEFLAVMLGVRRPGVTVGLQVLEGLGLIRAERGLVTIRDRDGLVALANGGYGEFEREYDRLIGQLTQAP